MMKSLTILIILLGLESTASAHMLMSNPPSLRYKGNPNVPSGSVDFNLVAPLQGSGSDFPCKGYQVDLGTPAGASVADYTPGETYNFTIEGGASHNGGSCQASLSYDKGKSFTVIHSYVGNCPTSAGGSFDFKVPADAPSGAALFAWTWFNKVGNREIYMNCASVTVKGSASNKRADTSFSSRPSIFVANLQNGCSTGETQDISFPNPGPDVTNPSNSPAGFGMTGVCKAVNGIGAADSKPGSFVPSSVPAGSAAPSSSNAGITSAAAGTSATSSASVAPSSTFTPQGGSSPSADGSCGGQVTCIGSVHGSCCSKFGWCGSTSDYCGTGCQSALGTCGNSTAAGSTALTVSTDKTCGPSTTNTCQGSSFGNCCSQFGYCGSTGEYCGTGCQLGFGNCGLSSSGASSVYSQTPLQTSTASSQSPAPSQSPASGITTPQPSTFITIARTTSSPALQVIPLTSSTRPDGVVTLVPATPKSRA